MKKSLNARKEFFTFSKIIENLVMQLGRISSSTLSLERDEPRRVAFFAMNLSPGQAAYSRDSGLGTGFGAGFGFCTGRETPMLISRKPNPLRSVSSRLMVSLLSFPSLTHRRWPAAFAKQHGPASTT
jgi:hypothetical protein